MAGETILILGKALIWFAVPLCLACWELWQLRRDDNDTAMADEARRGARGDASTATKGGPVGRRE